MTVTHRFTDARPHRDMLSMLTEAIASDLDLQRVLQTVTDIGTEVSGAEFGAFFYNERDHTGRVYQLHVLSGAFLETFAAMPKPRITGLFEPTFTGVAAVRCDDVLQDPRFSGMPPGHLPVRSYLAVPVVTRADEVIGALLFGHRDPARFDADCEQTIETVAAHAAVAVENARLFAAEQTARRRAEEATARLALLQSLASRLSVALTVDETVAAVTDVISGPIGASRVGVYLREDGGYRRMSGGATVPDVAFVPDDKPNAITDTAATGQPLVLDRADVLVEYPQLAARMGDIAATAIVLPLTSGDASLGACTLAWQDERDLDAADVEMLFAAAAQVASTVDRVRLFEAERDARAELAHSIRAATETSRALQRSLLPRSLPHTDGMTVAVRYQASDVDAEVGGDWYDVIPREHGAVLVIGDVQGHNLAAAALMGQLRTGLHAYLAEGHPVEEALARANHLMPQLTDGMMATCCLVDVDLDARELRMASAGHPSAVCVTADAELLVLPHQVGLPLGVVPDSTWPVTVGTLGAADRLVLFSDGLVERRGTDIYTGIDRLRSLTRSLVDRNTEDAASIIVDDLGTDAEDDLALLVCDIARTGAGRASVALGDAVNPARTFRIAGRSSSVRILRVQTQQALAAWGLGTLDYTASLIVSELVTNVLRHAGRAGTLQLQPLRDGVRILASDGDDRLPDLDLAPDAVSTGGRGLFLVQALAERWGVQLNSVGKTIWVELRTSQPNLLIPANDQQVAG